MLFLALTLPPSLHAAAPAGAVAGWGDDVFGELQVPAGLPPTVAVAGGSFRSLALLTNGTVAVWGNATVDQIPPANLTNATAVAAGGLFNLAIDSSLGVVAWGGQNAFGETNVPPNLGWPLAIGAGFNHGLAVTTNGSVVAWGDNSSGQTNVPTGLAGVVAVAGGFGHSLALKGDGTVAAWGDNSQGQCSLPSNLTNVVAIAAGYYHNLALVAGGGVVAWGRNDSGQAAVPPGLSNTVAIAAGESFSVALGADGTLRAWGSQTNAGYGLTGGVSIAAGQSHGLVVTTPLAAFVTAQPASASGIGGSPSALVAGALAPAGAGYQWRLNGANLAGATGSVLSFANLLPANAGHYTVVASTSQGSATSGLLSLTVQTLPPAILTQPVSQSAPAGSSATFTVTASGLPPLTYQWQFNGGNLPGATNSALVLTNLQSSNGGAYEVVVGNPYGSTISASAALAVNSYGEALGTPFLAWVSRGNALWTVETTVTYDGVSAASTGELWANESSTLETSLTGPATLSFWWNFAGYFPGPYGASSATFSVNGAPQAELSGPSGWVPVSVFLGAGTQVLDWTYAASAAWGPFQDMDAVFLDQVEVAWGGTLVITQSPPSQAVLEGTTVTMEAAALGTPPISYQWQCNQTNVPGATNATLTLASAQGFNSGAYSAQVSSPAGVTNTPPASLLVIDLAVALDATNLVWTTSGDAPWAPETSVTADGFAAAQSGAIIAGQQSALQTTVSGPGTLAFDWVVNSPGATDYASFTVDGIEQRRIVGMPAWQRYTNYLAPGAHALQWSYTKTDNQVLGWDAAFLDEVAYTPGPTPPYFLTSPTNFVAPAGSNATFTASLGGAAPQGSQWFFNHQPLSGATNPILTLSGVQLTNAGAYSLQVTNPYGVAGTTVSLTVLDLAGALNTTNLVWTTGGPNDWYPELATNHDGVGAAQSGALSANQQSTMETTVPGPATLTFWWKVSSSTNAGYVSFSVDGVEQARISGNQNWQQYTSYLSTGAHTLTWAYTKTDGVVAGADAAWVDQVAWQSGSTAPFIVSSPTNLSALVGATATLTVAAQGTPPLAYQWLWNQQPLPGATNSSLVIAQAQPSDSGAYAAVVTNSFGSVTSATALLTMPNLYAWGAGTNISRPPIPPNYGQSLIPTNLGTVLAVAAGGFHSVALLPGGKVAVWGSNGNAQTNVPANLTNAVAVAAGWQHSVALRTDGTVVVWGNELYAANQQPPTSATNLVSVSAGWFHNLGLRANGTVVGWGLTNLTVPASWPHYAQGLVPSILTGVAAVAAGGAHSLALLTNGTVVAWGWNGYGQTNVPAGLSNVVAIAAGGSNSVALKSDGTLVAWGCDISGETDVPAGLTNVAAIAAGAAHTMALLADGSIVAWGANAYGQATPPNLGPDVNQIAAGGYHSLAVVNTGPVAFLGLPQDQTVYSNTPVTLVAPCLGAPPLSYQWILDGTNVPGATNSILFFPAAQYAEAGAYQLAVANSYGAATSGALTLTVNNPAPQFTLQPTNTSVIQNSNFTFQALAVGPVPVGYQWLFNGAPIAGATGTAWTITNAQRVNAGIYSVVATNAFGATAITNLTLSFIGLPEALNATNLAWYNLSTTPWFAESGTTHDGVAAAEVGPIPYLATSVLQTPLIGPGTLTYWWFTRNNASFDIVLDGTTLSRSGAPSWTAGTLNLTAGAHTVSFAVANTYDPQGDYAFLDQVVFTPGLAAPAISSQPASQALAAGGTLTLGCGATGSPPLLYQWAFNGLPLAGATASALSVANAQAANAGGYTVTVSNGAGAVTSSTATVTVTPAAPTFVAQPASVTVPAGGTALISASISGTTPIACQWLFNGQPIPGATSTALAMSNLTTAASGTYALALANVLGSALSSNAVLAVYTAADVAAALNNPPIAWSTTNVPWFPETNTSYDGVSAAQSGAVSGAQASSLIGTLTGPATVSFWWQVNCNSAWMSLAFLLDGVAQSAITGTVGWASVTNYLGDGAHTLEWNFYPVYAAFAGGTGWVDQVAVVPGGTAPFLTTQPAGAAANAGASVTFSSGASGTPPLGYQWLFNGAVLPGATAASLALSNVQTNNAGAYTVWVTNEAGSVTSAAATLAVNSAPPSITLAPARQSAAIGGFVSFSAAASGSAPISWQWLFNGVPVPGATSATLALGNVQTTNAGTYAAVAANAFGSVTTAAVGLEVNPTAVLDYWMLGSRVYPAPLGLSNIVAITAGAAHTVALRVDGTVVAWGSGSYGLTNVPAGLSNVVAVAAGEYHTVALRSDGTVVAWGDNTYSQLLVPQGLSNVVALAAAGDDTFALRSDGTVAGWGTSANGQLNLPPGLGNVLSISAGPDNGFAVGRDGSLTQWGSGPSWTANGVSMQLAVAPAARNAASVGAGLYSAWLLNNAGDLQGFGYDANPFAAAGVAAIAASPSLYLGPGADYPIGLMYGGTLLPTSAFNLYGLFSLGLPVLPATITNAIGLATSYGHAAVLVNDGTPAAVGSARAGTLAAGSTLVLAPGVMGGQPMTYQWLFNGASLGGATNMFLVFTNVPLAAAGFYQCVGSNPQGSATNAGVSVFVTRGTPSFGPASFDPQAGLSLQINQLSGHGPIVIYGSPDLFQWTPIWTNPPVLGTLNFLDPSATQGGRQFYRAAEQ